MQDKDIFSIIKNFCSKEDNTNIIASFIHIADDDDK